MTRAKWLVGPEGKYLESLYAYSRNNKIKINQSEIFRYVGYILLNLDDGHMPEAEVWIQKAIEAGQRNQMLFHLGKDCALYAQWHKRNGDRSSARENLGKAIKILGARIFP